MAAVLVTGLTAAVDEHALREFFGYSGEVTSVELHDEEAKEGSPAARSAIVSFASASSLDTALLLSGATIVAGEPAITVVAAAAPAGAAGAAAAGGAEGAGAVPQRVRGPDGDLIDFQRVSDVMSTLMAKGFVLGKDALAKAKELDEKTGVTSTIKETALDLNAKLRLGERTKAGAAALDAKARELNEKYQLVERSKGLAADATAAVSGAVTAVQSSEAVAKATTSLRGFLSKAGDKAGDVMKAAAAKVEAMQQPQAAPAAAPAAQ